ncbi:MAG TPA: prolyl oligopeptidase family serine peptidase, partial [Acidimicrobiia bacterium]|nr:prolyl oligopeptidase family serine peptidase [Acidimicrobiia bacterium]
REELWAASPLRHATSITTPTLVLHSETDWRCPIEQGEQLFALLQGNGVESEMVRFPGESQNSPEAANRNTASSASKRFSTGTHVI